MIDIYRNHSHAPITLAAGGGESEETKLPAPFLNLIKNVFKGNIKAGDIDDSTALQMAGEFTKAVKEGIEQEGAGDSYDYATPDFKMLESLETSVYRFSAAKSYNVNQMLTELLKKEDHANSFSKFEQAARAELGVYVGQWGKVEYNAAMGAAQMCAKWSRFEADEADMPYLQFKTSKSEHVCPICAPYDDVIRPVKDLLWEIASPLLHYGCYCTLLQLPESNATPTPKNDLPDPELIPPIFRTNYARKMQAFPPDHPYYTHVPKKSINAWAKENIKQNK